MSGVATEHPSHALRPTCKTKTFVTKMKKLTIIANLLMTESACLNFTNPEDLNDMHCINSQQRIKADKETNMAY